MTVKAIDLNQTETAYLEMVLNSDLKMRIDASVHAIAHGSDYEDATLTTVSNIINKIKNAEPLPVHKFGE